MIVHASASGAPGPATPFPLISVVIPVFGRESGIEACLGCLERQDLALPFEVIVVDNGGGASEEGLVDRYPWAHVVREHRPGSYAARNRGLEEARAPVVAFTDADCLPSVGWLSRGLAALQRLGRPGMVAGRIEIVVRDPARPTAAELYESVASFRQEAYVRRWRFGATGNLLVHREVVDRAGAFNPGLQSMGDVEFGFRVHAAGFAQAYAPEAVVRHLARRTTAELHDRGVRTMTGFVGLAMHAGWPFGRMLAYAPVGLVPLFAIVGGPTLRGFRQRARVAAVACRLLASRAGTATRLLLGTSATLRAVKSTGSLRTTSEGG